MKILSLQVGTPKKIEWQGRSIQTSMQKTAAPGPLKVSMTTIEGDRFADPRFHGTPESVLYALGKETYSLMGQRLNKDIVPGFLGENLTIDQLDESQIEVGDVFQIGTVQAEATGPRIPCEKLNYVHQSVDAQMAFVKVMKPGVYFKIIQTGEIPTDTELKTIKKSGSGISIAELYKVMTDLSMYKKCDNPARLFEMIENPHLSEQIKVRLQRHAGILKLQKD